MENKKRGNYAPVNSTIKDTQFQAQMTKVFRAFLERPKTMLEASIETNVLRANICRYVAEWRKENRIDEVKKGFCPISKHRAGFLTTNPSLFIHSKTESND